MLQQVLELVLSIEKSEKWKQKTCFSLFGRGPTVPILEFDELMATEEECYSHKFMELKQSLLRIVDIGTFQQ